VVPNDYFDYSNGNILSHLKKVNRALLRMCSGIMGCAELLFADKSGTSTFVEYETVFQS